MKNTHLLGHAKLKILEQMQGQDYVFVRAFVPFVASVLIKAWRESDDRSDVEVILSGMAALNDEIEWFKIEASKWDVQLNNIVTHKTTEKYCRYNFLWYFTPLLCWIESLPR